MITKFVLNTVLHHMGLYWIIYSSKQMIYDIKENNHPDWLNRGPRYNTAICSKWHETVFGDFIKNDRTDICNIMRSVPTHVKQKPAYVDDAGSGFGRAIPKNATIVAL